MGVWAQITVDEQAGLVYLPVESPTQDIYGGNRPGANLFGESLVAVDLKTGQRKWHFQFTHHPIWDLDIPAAPILADIVVDGKAIKAVAVPTKQSTLYVFDRITGQPVWPIVEKPVPAKHGAWRENVADTAVSDQAAALCQELSVEGRHHRLHAGAARSSVEAARTLQVGRDALFSACGGRRQRNCSAQSKWATRSAARTGPAAATTPSRRSCSCTRRNSGVSAYSVKPDPDDGKFVSGVENRQGGGGTERPEPADSSSRPTACWPRSTSPRAN